MDYLRVVRVKKPSSAVLWIILAALVLLVAHLESRFAPVKEALREEERSVAHLRACDAMITDGEHYHSMPSPRCYFFKRENQ